LPERPAYFVPRSVTEENSFTALTQVANMLNIFFFYTKEAN
jgi:hypothetical protein